MKKLLLLLFVGLGFVGCSKNDQKINVRWATFNIRMDTKADSLNAWSYRKDRACQWIKDNQIDIFGAQEVLHNQFEDILERLPNFKGLGVGREDGKQKGEYSAVFYNADKYEALESNTFWLSEHPDSVGKKGWDAALPRIVTWGKLKDKKTGKIFMAVNTHFDHIGVEARKQSALLIIQKIKEIIGEKPAVVTGDFNVDDKSDAYKTITTNEFVLKDAYKVTEKHTGVSYSFHSYGRVPVEKRSKIDFIFVTPQIRVIETCTPEEIPGAFLSDHNPHYAVLEF